MFRFVPPDRTTLRKRRSLFRDYQRLMDARVARAEGGTPRFHIDRTVDGLEQNSVLLTDGREIRYPEFDEKILQAARQWMLTGSGSPPPLPQSD